MLMVVVVMVVMAPQMMLVMLLSYARSSGAEIYARILVTHRVSWPCVCQARRDPWFQPCGR